MKSTLTGMRRIQTGLAAGLTLLALTGTVSGCSSDDGNEPIEGASTEPGSSDETDNEANENEAADIAALTDLYEAYWDAMVELENSTELDPTVLDGLATQVAAETQISRMRSYHDQGIHRQGEPTFGDVTVTVDGDTATVEACKNEADWKFVTENGQEIDDPAFENLGTPQPNVLSAERVDEGWQINETLSMEEATISC